MTQQELAAAAGISASAVSQIEAGNRREPSVKVLAAFERALGDYTLLREYQPSPEAKDFLDEMGDVLGINEDERAWLSQLRFGEGKTPERDQWTQLLMVYRALPAKDT